MKTALPGSTAQSNTHFHALIIYIFSLKHNSTQGGSNFQKYIIGSQLAAPFLDYISSYLAFIQPIRCLRPAVQGQHSYCTWLISHRKKK